MVPKVSAARKRKTWPIVVLAVGVLAAGAGGWWVVGGASDPSGPADVGPTTAVTRGPLIVSVTESGEMEAEKRKVISNELQWPVIIKSVTAEGDMVKTGDTIIVFECKELMDAIASQQLAVTAASSASTQARENLLLKRKEMDNSVRKAEQAVVDAKADLRRYEEAEGPVKLADAEADIHTARRDLALAEGKLLFKLKVNADKELNSPYSDSEIEADKLGVERLKLALNKAISNRDMLQKYDHPRQTQKLQMGVEDADLALARAKLEARSEILKAETDADAKKATSDLQTKKLQELEEEATKLIVKAEMEGLVVYDTGSNRWNPNTVTIQVGEKISPRQQLMIIPDMSTLQIQTKVYESIIDQVKPGLKTHVRLETRPEAVLPAKVVKVAVLPDSQHGWLNPGVKIFKVTVKLDEDVPDLKPGMSAQVEIELARLEDVLSVPVAALFTEQEKTFCYRVVDARPDRVEVKVGKMNDTRVQVLSGVAEGDKVLLTPPVTPKGELEPGGQGAEPQPVDANKPKAPVDRDRPDAELRQAPGKNAGERPPRPAGDADRGRAATGGARTDRGEGRPRPKAE